MLVVKSRTGGRRSRIGEIEVARIFTACMVSLAAGALLLLGGCGKPGGAQSAPPPQVSVAQVLEKRVKDWDEFTGRLQAVETVEIRPRVSGYIDKLAFTEGSQVKRGDLLFVIDPRPYQAEYDRAAADVKRYKTALELARIELARVQRLKDSGAVSQEELDERKSTVAQAEANLGGAEAALETASLNLNFTRVQLLVSGEYTAILIEDRAVNTDQDQKYVLLLGANNQIEYRKVKLGRVIQGLRIVREGLKPGDVIVVNGAQRVHPGVTVAPQRVTMGATGTDSAAPASG